MRKNKAVFLSVVLETNEDGYLATVPGIQGAFAEGDTPEDAIFNCLDVVKMITAYRTERDEDLGFGTVEFKVNSRMTVAMPMGLA